MFWDVAVVRGVANRTVNELSSKVGVPGVSEGFGDDVNEYVVESDRMIAPPRHRARCIKVECIDRCVRSLTRPAIATDDVIPRFVSLYEEAVVVLNVIFEPEIGLPHGSTKDGTEVAELDTRQVLHDPEEVGPARD